MTPTERYITEVFLGLFVILSLSLIGYVWGMP
jgi:hypothetical protein